MNRTFRPLCSGRLLLSAAFLICAAPAFAADAPTAAEDPPAPGTPAPAAAPMDSPPATTAAAPPAVAQPRFALAIERAAGLSLLKVDDDRDNPGSFASIGGNVTHVFAAPRLTFDYLSPQGPTVGVGIWASRFSQDDATFLTTSIEARFGYRVAVNPNFDFVPRIAFGRTALSYERSGGDQSDRVYSGSLSGTGVIRVTSAFNLLAGAVIDRVLSTESSSTGVTIDQKDPPTVHSLQLWFGIGGYI